MNTKKDMNFFMSFYKVIFKFIYFFLLAFLAPIPIPAAIKKTKPPSIGQAGSNGSTHSSGGGGSCAIELKLKPIVKTSKVIPTNTIFNLFFIFKITCAQI